MCVSLQDTAINNDHNVGQNSREVTVTHVNLVGVYYISKNRDYYINHKISTLEVQIIVLC